MGIVQKRQVQCASQCDFGFFASGTVAYTMYLDNSSGRGDVALTDFLNDNLN